MATAKKKVRGQQPGYPARLVHSDSRNQTDIFLKFASRSQTFIVSNIEAPEEASKYIPDLSFAELKEAAEQGD